jgi:hypothetical protein
MGNNEAVDLVMAVLHAKAANDGQDEMLYMAQEMVVTAAAIYAREAGADAARQLLDMAAICVDNVRKQH